MLREGVVGFGVVLMATVTTWAGETPTYAKDIAPIFNQKCVGCHRPGDIAPMSLLAYEEVRPWVKSIAKNVSEGVMPPWHADPAIDREYTNDRSLTPEQIETIAKWAASGAPRGPQADMPPPPAVSDTEWRLGEPDHIVTFDPFTVQADGPDQFKDLVAPTGLDRDVWVKAIEILPGERSVVHHVIVFQSQGNHQDPTGWLGAWAAGTDPMEFPEGTGRLLKQGKNLVADMHYHPSGVEATDQTRIGLHFVDEGDVEKELVNLWVMNVDFAIPPGAENYEVFANYTFPQASLIRSFTPHMHYRGKDFTYTATYPDGREEVLFRAKNYDFNWQTHYELAEPVAVPAGTRIDCKATYDNSVNNPVNPDPTKTVTFGDESYDEMMIGFLDYTVVDGLRPESDEVQVDRMRNELTQTHPGEAYDAVLIAGNHRMRLAFHLPREGEGYMAMDVIGSLQKVPTDGLTWEGNAFEAKIAVPGEGPITFKGTVEEPTGVLNARAHMDNGFKLPVEGERVQ